MRSVESKAWFETLVTELRHVDSPPLTPDDWWLFPPLRNILSTERRYKYIVRSMRNISNTNANRNNCKHEEFERQQQQKSTTTTKNQQHQQQIAINKTRREPPVIRHKDKKRWIQVFNKMK